MDGRLKHSISSLSMIDDQHEIPEQDPNDGSDIEPVLVRTIMAGAVRFSNSGLIVQKFAEAIVREAANVAAQHTHTVPIGYYLEIIRRGPTTEVPCIIDKDTATGCNIHTDTYSPDCTAPWVPCLEESMEEQPVCFLSMDFGTEPQLPRVLVYVLHSWAMTAAWQCLSYSSSIPVDGHHERRAKRHAEKTVLTWVGDIIGVARQWDMDPTVVVAMSASLLQKDQDLLGSEE